MAFTEAQHQAAAWIRDQALALLHPLPRSVAIFGSFAKGMLTPDSDLDLLFIGDAIPHKPSARSRWIRPLTQAIRAQTARLGIPRSISPLMISESGWTDSIGLRLSLSDHAWILFDDGFLSSTLHESAQAIQRGDWWKKSLRDGGWLWVPKGVSA